VNGVRLHPLDRGQFMTTIESFLACGLSHVVHFIPADPTVHAMDAPEYRQVLNGGDLNVPDGMSVVWALRLQGVRSERLPGTDAIHLIARYGENDGLRHYFFGGEPKVLEALGTRMKVRYPTLDLVGAESPPFRALSDVELRRAADRIRAAGTQILHIGLGTPKQDLVASKLRELDAAPVILCVGAAFDFLAGNKRRAPEWMQQAGLEWLHRMWSEPGRLGRRYLIGNPRFVWGVTRELLAKRSG